METGKRQDLHILKKLKRQVRFEFLVLSVRLGTGSFHGICQLEEIGQPATLGPLVEVAGLPQLVDLSYQWLQLVQRPQVNFWVQ